MINRSLNLFITLFVILVVGIETYNYWFHQLRPWQPVSPVGRMFFYYSFYTVLSNIMLAIGCFILAIKPNSSSTFFKVIRLSGLVGVLITMIVYNVMLRGIHHPPTVLLQFANECLHVGIPLLGLISWLIYGPFPRISVKAIGYGFLILMVYGIYIFVRGYYTNQYPYPFINVNRVGYEKAGIAVVGVAILFFALVLLLKGIEMLRINISSVIIKRRKL